MGVRGRNWLTGYLGEDVKVVEGEYDFQRSKSGFYERVVIPTVVYGLETCSLSSQERRKI